VNRNAVLILGRLIFADNEPDFLAWATFVAARIDKEAGVAVHVDLRDEGDTLQSTRVVALDEATEKLVEKAVQRIWQSWLALSEAEAAPDTQRGGYASTVDDFDSRPTPTMVRKAMPVARRA